MTTKSYVFRTPSLFVALVFLLNTVVYATPIERSTLRQPATAVAVVNAKSDTDSSSVRKAQVAILAVILSLANLANPVLSQPLKAPVASSEAVKASIETEKVQELLREVKENLDTRDQEGVEDAIYRLYKKNAFTEEHIPILLEVLAKYKWIPNWEGVPKVNIAILPLAKFGATVAPDLIRLADSKAQINAIKALGHLNFVSDDIMDLLGRKLDDESEDIRSAALYALYMKGLSAKVFVPKILTLLNSKHLQPDEIYLSASILKNTGFCNESVLSTLIGYIREGSFSYSLHAADAIDNFGPVAKNAIPELIELLGDKNSYRASHAGKALGGIGSDAIPALKNALRSKNPELRKNAFETIRYHMKEIMDEDDLLDIYKKGLQDEDIDVKVMALREIINQDTQVMKSLLPAILEVYGYVERGSDPGLINTFGVKRDLIAYYGIAGDIEETLRDIGPISNQEAYAHNIAPMAQVFSALLQETVQTIPVMLDGTLEFLARDDGKRMKEIVDEFFSRPKISELLAEFDNLYPKHLTTEQALAILTILEDNFKYETDDTWPRPRTTWASYDASYVYNSLRLYEIGKRSRLAKLFILSGMPRLYLTDYAKFRWSRAAHMPINVGRLDWTLDDLPFLAQMYNNADVVSNPDLKTGIEIGFLKLYPEYLKERSSSHPPEFPRRIQDIMDNIPELKSNLFSKLKTKIESDSEYERWPAAYCLGVLGSAYKQESEPILLKALSEYRYKYVASYHVIEALRRIGSSSNKTISGLIGFLEEIKGDTLFFPTESSHEAAILLAEIGPPAKEALPVLERIAEKHELTRIINEQAIKRIQGNTEGQQQIPSGQPATKQGVTLPSVSPLLTSVPGITRAAYHGLAEKNRRNVSSIIMMPISNPTSDIKATQQVIAAIERGA